MTAISRVPTPVAAVTPAATEVRTRARPRAVDVSATPERPAYETELENFVRANIAANANGRLAEAAKKELGKAMAAAKVDAFTMVVDGRKYDATFKAGSADYIDVAELYGKVDLKTFLSIVTASQGAVKDAVGSNVTAAVTKTKITDVAVKVKENKN